MKISVVIPVYNKEKYMDDLFQCLLSQTFEEFECILIDDGSTDASGEICDKVACIDKRFEVIHIPNSGVSHARNVGIDASCGEYITFIDADDRIPNNYLENLYETIIESGVDLSICTITKIWHSGKKKKIQLPGSGTFDISELLLNFADYQKKTGIYGYCCGKIILKELVGNIRFDERIKLAEDFDFFLKLYPKVSKICFNDKTEYFYLQESENSSAMVKESGWSHYAYSVEFAYADKKRYLCKNGDDPFMQLFVKDYILRESCSSCHFKGYHRVSDITLGDFWGIWNINPKMDDNKGTSLILTHTAKGEKMMNAVSENIKCEQVYLEQAARENPSLLRSSVHKQNRDIVLKTIESENFQEILPLLQVKQPQRRSKKEIIKRVLKKLCGLG